jgi:hypothetical protein
MARSQLEKTLFQEIKNYLGIPYAKNHWLNNRLVRAAIFGGKGNWQEIRYATLCAAKRDQLTLKLLSPQDIFNFQKKNHIGIDCSGLAYHLLDFLDRLKGGQGILYKVIGGKPWPGQYGVRSVSADDLTKSPNSSPITNYSELQPGDLIRHHRGQHVLLIIGYRKNQISYVHSSQTTTTTGVHTGQITIHSQNQPLSFQPWSDTTPSGKAYQYLHYPQQGDGIFRLNCWR